jgi:hypothetical protein
MPDRCEWAFRQAQHTSVTPMHVDERWLIQVDVNDRPNLAHLARQTPGTSSALLIIDV